MSNKGRGGRGGNKSPRQKDFQKSNSSPKVGTAKLVEADEDDEFVVEAMQDLSNLKIKNDYDKIAYNVAKILIPFLGKTSGPQLNLILFRNQVSVSLSILSLRFS